MDGSPEEQVINELFPYFEALETRSAAIVQFLKDKGLTTDEEFAPYLEQAANGSNVKWLAARIRVERLLSSAVKEEKDKEADKAEGTKAEPTAEKKPAESSGEQNTEKSTAKSNESDNGRIAEKPTDKTGGKTTETESDKPGKKNIQASDKNDAAEGNREHESGGNTAAKGSAEKKTK